MKGTSYRLYTGKFSHLFTDTIASMPLTIAVPQRSETQCLMTGAAIDWWLSFADHTCPSASSGPISGRNICHLFHKVCWQVTKTLNIRLRWDLSGCGRRWVCVCGIRLPQGVEWGGRRRHFESWGMKAVRSWPAWCGPDIGQGHNQLLPEGFLW